MQAEPSTSLFTQAASRTLTTNQPSVTGVRPASSCSSRASSTTAEAYGVFDLDRAGSCPALTRPAESQASEVRKPLTNLLRRDQAALLLGRGERRLERLSLGARPAGQAGNVRPHAIQDGVQEQIVRGLDQLGGLAQ